MKLQVAKQCWGTGSTNHTCKQKHDEQQQLRTTQCATMSIPKKVKKQNEH
jgi:hypothetical protein